MMQPFTDSKMEDSSCFQVGESKRSSISFPNCWFRSPSLMALHREVNSLALAGFPSVLCTGSSTTFSMQKQPFGSTAIFTSSRDAKYTGYILDSNVRLDHFSLDFFLASSLKLLHHLQSLHLVTGPMPYVILPVNEATILKS